MTVGQRTVVEWTDELLTVGGWNLLAKGDSEPVFRISDKIHCSGP
jgi:hypothetical protein